MINVRFNKIKRKLVKVRDKSWDRIKAAFVGWVKNVKFKAMDLPNAAHRKTNLVLLAHYSAQNSVHAYVFRMIEQLQAADCDVILVSTADMLPQKDIETLKAGKVDVIVRRNIGYDFGSWRTAVDAYPAMKNDYKTIIFANDSVYGPIGDLNPVLQALRERKLDVWGLTSSEERGWHVQTYFWAMANNSLRGAFFDYFWHTYYKFYSRRQAVIQRYELKVAELARKQFGLQVGAHWDRRASKSGAASATNGKTRVNPMRDFWLDLVSNQNFPFIKRELFRLHPVESPELRSIAETVKVIDANAWSLFENHLLTSSQREGTGGEKIGGK